MRQKAVEAEVQESEILQIPLMDGHTLTVVLMAEAVEGGLC